MEIIKNKQAEKTTVELCGRLDTMTAPELDGMLPELTDDATELVIDMTKLEYISSAGLRVILKAQKIMQKKGVMTVTGVNESIMEVFEITGFADILNIE